MADLLDDEAGEETDGDEPPRPDEYRDVAIEYLTQQRYGPSVRMALLENRVILAMSDDALKSAIDIAKDDTGGFIPGGKAQRLATMAGDGSAIFMFDLAALTKTFWPLLMQFSEMAPENFPLVDLPSAGKMARLLGPELSVFKPDADGMLLDSRGQVPLATKAVIAYPTMMMMGMSVF